MTGTYLTNSYYNGFLIEEWRGLETLKFLERPNLSPMAGETDTLLLERDLDCPTLEGGVQAGNFFIPGVRDVLPVGRGLMVAEGVGAVLDLVREEGNEESSEEIGTEEDANVPEVQDLDKAGGKLDIKDDIDLEGTGAGGGVGRATERVLEGVGLWKL